MRCAYGRWPLALVAAAALLGLAALSSAEREEDCPPQTACQSSPRSAVCSGHGRCVCGQCLCDQYLSGQFCECDDRSCFRHTGRLCGGEERGTCRCGQCACRPGWQGDACECRSSNHTCVDPGSGRVCNEKGVCECGSCRCFQEYSGHYCQDCPTCVGQCSSYKNCVECLAFDMGPLKDRCQSACSRMEVELEDEPTVSSSGERQCVFFIDDCRYSFIYGSGVPLRVQRRPSCPQAAISPAIGWWNGASSSLSTGAGALVIALYSVICWLQ